MISCNPHPRICLLILEREKGREGERERKGEREREREKERERERNMDVKEKHQLFASHMLPNQGSNL